MSGKQGNPFEVLGLPASASEAEVKAAYRAASRRLHPDAGGSDEAFRQVSEAAALAADYASGRRPNPFLAKPEPGVAFVAGYDRHSHSPPPPPNPWRNPWLGGGLFWILPVIAGIFMLSGAAGPYFLPVFAGSLAVFGVIVWLVLRRVRRQ